jgi:hypothetical protein
VSGNLLDPENRRTLILAALGVLLACCCCAAVLTLGATVVSGEPEGTCVVASPVGRADWDHCYDNELKKNCELLSDTTFYQFTSCNALGFTKKCPGEYAWRYPSYPCD